MIARSRDVRLKCRERVESGSDTAFLITKLIDTLPQAAGLDYSQPYFPLLSCSLTVCNIARSETEAPDAAKYALSDATSIRAS